MPKNAEIEKVITMLKVERGIYKDLIVIRNGYYVMVIQDYQVDELIEMLGEI